MAQADLSLSMLVCVEEEEDDDDDAFETNVDADGNGQCWTVRSRLQHHRNVRTNGPNARRRELNSFIFVVCDDGQLRVSNFQKNAQAGCPAS